MVKLAIAVLAAIVSANALAQQGASPPWYAGAAIGYGRVYFNDNNLFTTAPSSVSKDETDRTWRLYAGYRLNRHLALEGGWTDLGRYTFTRTTASGSGTARFSSRGVFADALGVLPLDRWSLFGKVGAIYASNEKELSTSGSAQFAAGADVHPTSRDVGWKYGAGASYDFTRRWAARLDYDAYRVGSDKTGEFWLYVLSVGGAYRF